MIAMLRTNAGYVDLLAQAAPSLLLSRGATNVDVVNLQPKCQQNLNPLL